MVTCFAYTLKTSDPLVWDLLLRDMAIQHKRMILNTRFLPFRLEEIAKKSFHDQVVFDMVFYA